MSDIGARFVACKGWRWMPGMLVADYGGGVRVSGMCAEFIHGSAADTPVNRHGPVWMRLRRDEAHAPVTDDPATLGCILALVRDAHNDPTICAVWVESRGAMVVKIVSAKAALRIAWNHDERTEPGGPFRSEAGALLAALESAP